MKAYVIPEYTSNIHGKTAEMSVNLSPSKVVFGFEGDATNEQVGLPTGQQYVGHILENYGSSNRPETSKIKKIKSKK